MHESEIVCRRRDLCTQRGSGEEDREPQSSQRRAQSPALESDRLRHHGQFPSTSRGWSTPFGKGFEQLPASVLERFKPALVGALGREELVNGLKTVANALIADAIEAGDLDPKVKTRLQEIVVIA